MEMLRTAVIIILVVCINRIVGDDDQCIQYEFEHPFFPGISCEDIYNKNPQTHDKSGYYWITNGLQNVYCGMNYTGLSCEDIYQSNPETGDKNGYYPISNSQWTFCNMTAIASDYFSFSCAGVGGEWKRIASFNISAGDDCPIGWNKSSHNNVSFCRSPSDSAGCYSTTFSTDMSYNRVCGRVRGYQRGSPDANRRFIPIDINTAYIDGVSITHGTPPDRQHIWSYIAGLLNRGTVSSCSCAPQLGRDSPSFVGSNYYCEAGAGDNFDYNEYYFSDPLWDGSGCFSGNMCCANPNLPWFQHQLNEMIQDDIEVRICRDEEFSNEAILVDILELYVQ